MPQITFLTGNGLDIALGLETEYVDFYNYIVAHKWHENNRIYQAIKSDPKTWANFEYQLGSYTRYIDELEQNDMVAESKSFHNDLEEVTLDLIKYLKIKENKLDIEKIRHGITRTSFFEGLSEGQREPFNRLTAPDQGLSFNFINLNYTSTLEKILPRLQRLQVPNNIVFNQILHLHGSLDEDVTIGVNDESQMSSHMTGTERDDLIKSRLIQSMKDGRIARMNTILGNTSVLVLFGTSIGDTDTYIWEMVLKWLSDNTNRYVIIHKYNKKYTTETKAISRRKKIFQSEVEDSLLSKGVLDPQVQESLRERIFVIHNTEKIFIKDKA